MKTKDLTKPALIILHLPCVNRQPSYTYHRWSVHFRSIFWYLYISSLQVRWQDCRNIWWPTIATILSICHYIHIESQHVTIWPDSAALHFVLRYLWSMFSNIDHWGFSTSLWCTLSSPYLHPVLLTLAKLKCFATLVVPSSGCSLTEPTCICANAELARNITACVKTSCSIRDSLSKLVPDNESKFTDWPNQPHLDTRITVAIWNQKIGRIWCGSLVLSEVALRFCHSSYAFGPELKAVWT